MPPPAHPQPGADHHAHGEGRRDRQGRSASRWAPTTTSPSRSRSASSAAASRPRCAAAEMAGAGRWPRTSRSPPATSRSTSSAASWSCADEHVQLTYVEFEILAALARRPGPRVHARDAARAHLGRLDLPRPAHRRRPHPAPAREARGATRSTPEYLFTVRGVGYRFRDATRMSHPASDDALRNRLLALFFADHGGGDRLRLPLRGAAARFEPDGREAAAAREAGDEQAPRLAQRAAKSGRSQTRARRLVRSTAQQTDAG